MLSPDRIERLVQGFDDDPFALLGVHPDGWTRTAIANVAAMGRFSSDRSIREYARDVWKVEPVVVKAPNAPPSARPRH